MAERCVHELNSALHELFERRDDVYLIGEDLLDPYGGAFKVSQGLSTRWPSRVITTPISEASLVGVTAGMAIRGLRPILEIMFGDFIALGYDQIVNGVSKFREMYDDQVEVPLVVRLPMGGGRGYGPTHSQSLEKTLIGVPNVAVVAMSEFHNVGGLLTAAVEDAEPVFFVENKLMYGRALRRAADGYVGELRARETDDAYPGRVAVGKRVLGRRRHDCDLRGNGRARRRDGDEPDFRARGVLRGRHRLSASAARPRPRSRLGQANGSPGHARRGDADRRARSRARCRRTGARMGRSTPTRTARSRGRRDYSGSPRPRSTDAPERHRSGRRRDGRRPGRGSRCSRSC